MKKIEKLENDFKNFMGNKERTRKEITQFFENEVKLGIIGKNYFGYFPLLKDKYLGTIVYNSPIGLKYKITNNINLTKNNWINERIIFYCKNLIKLIRVLKAQIIIGRSVSFSFITNNICPSKEILTTKLISSWINAIDNIRTLPSKNYTIVDKGGKNGKYILFKDPVELIIASADYLRKVLGTNSYVNDVNNFLRVNNVSKANESVKVSNYLLRELSPKEDKDFPIDSRVEKMILKVITNSKGISIYRIIVDIHKLYKVKLDYGKVNLCLGNLIKSSKVYKGKTGLFYIENKYIDLNNKIEVSINSSIVKIMKNFNNAEIKKLESNGNYLIKVKFDNILEMLDLYKTFRNEERFVDKKVSDYISNLSLEKEDILDITENFRL